MKSAIDPYFESVDVSKFVKVKTDADKKRRVTARTAVKVAPMETNATFSQDAGGTLSSPVAITYVVQKRPPSK